MEFLFGDRKVTYEVDNQALHGQLLKDWNNGDGTLAHYAKRSDWSVETSNNGFSVATGGGVDFRSHSAIRVAPHQFAIYAHLGG